MEKSDIVYVTHSKDFRDSWDGKKLREIADSISEEDVLLEQKYYKNIAGYFFGTLSLFFNNQEYIFYQSQALTNSQKSLSELGSCIGRKFSFEVTILSGAGMEQFNEGFLICLPDEYPSVMEVLHYDHCTIQECPQELVKNLSNKSLSEAFHEELFSKIERKNGKMVFKTRDLMEGFIVLDNYKVFLSKAVLSFTEDQFIAMLDNLTFRAGVSDIKNKSFGTSWFRLSLPKSIKKVTRL